MTTTRRHATGSRLPRRGGYLLAVLLLALALAGCTGRHSAPDQGAAGGGRAVEFSQCMRHHGIGSFPDPDASGRLTIDQIANNTSIDTGSAAFQRALTACRDLQPAGFTGTRRSDDQQSAALAFAQCVRDNGVSDFPDPGPGAPLIDTNKIPSANQPGGMEKLQAALGKCGKQAQAAGVTR